MRPDLILHIGQSKTGTSSIQRCLGSRRQELLAEGVLYPRSPGAANHGLLPASLVPVQRLGHFHPNVWEGVSPEARLERFRRDFAREMDAIAPSVRLVIISAEQCSGLLVDVESIRRLHDLLAPRFARMRVVMYLRRQDQHVASSYTQALRVAVLHPPRLPAGGPAEMPGYDYAALLDRWAQVFGEEAIVPRVFEPSSLLGGDVVDDFFALCNLELRIPKDDPERQANLSIAPEGLALVRAMGAHLDRTLPGGLTAASPLWRRFMRSVSEVMPGKGWRPSPEEASAFMERFRDTNEAVRRRWLSDRERLFSEDYGKGASGDVAAGSESEAALAAACALLAQEISTAAAREAHQATQIGRLQERAGDTAQARSSYRAALRAVPDHPMAHFRLGLLEAEAGDPEAAEAHLNALRQAHPEDPVTERLARRLRRASPPRAIAS